MPTASLKITNDVLEAIETAAAFVFAVLTKSIRAIFVRYTRLNNKYLLQNSESSLRMHLISLPRDAQVAILPTMTSQMEILFR